MAFPTIITRASENSISGGRLGWWFRIIFRFFQFVLAITVIGLYAQDLDKARKEGKYMDSKWVYATFLGSISAMTALVYMTPYLKSWGAFAWDFILVIMWSVLSGIFGKMFIGENPEGNAGITRMKHAVYVDLTNLVFWFITACYGASVFLLHKKNKAIDASKV